MQVIHCTLKEHPFARGVLPWEESPVPRTQRQVGSSCDFTGTVREASPLPPPPSLLIVALVWAGSLALPLPPGTTTRTTKATAITSTEKSNCNLYHRRRNSRPIHYHSATCAVPAAMAP